MWKSIKENFESPDSYVSLALGLAVVLVVGMIMVNYFKSMSSQTAAESKRKAEISAQGAAMPMKYTVLEGDTLWSIAESSYKDGYKWADIAKANNLQNAERIEKDQVLTIPEIKPAGEIVGEVSSASTEVKAEKKTYTVVAGDDLWTIAQKQLKDGYRWPELVSKNGIVNPDVIEIGTVLELP